MERGLYNITATGVSTLLPINGSAGNVKSIRLSNYSTTQPITVDLYLYDSSTVRSYYLHDLVIPIKTSLLLDDSVEFDNSVLGMSINITGTTPFLSIIIK